jgi:hypothetical protein
VSALALLNFLVLQWFGVRLARNRVAVHTGRYPDVCIGARVMMSSWDRHQSGKVVAVDDETITLQWFSLLRWIWTLTGWWSECRWIARRRD